jgi:hypothetical protein
MLPTVESLIGWSESKHPIRPALCLILLIYFDEAARLRAE